MTSLPFELRRVQACHGYRVHTKVPILDSLLFGPRPRRRVNRSPIHISRTRFEVRHRLGQSDSLQRHKVLRAESQQCQSSMVGCVCVGGMNVHGFNLTSPHAIRTVSQYPKSFQILPLLIIIISIFQTGETEAKSG